MLFVDFLPEVPLKGWNWTKALPFGFCWGSKLLHYGSLPAFSIYGCWEIAGDEFPDGVSTWPFSLVAESTAEVYVIQKQERFWGWAFSGEFGSVFVWWEWWRCWSCGVNLDGLFDGNLMVKLMRCIYKCIYIYINVYIYIYLYIIHFFYDRKTSLESAPCWNWVTWWNMA